MQFANRKILIEFEDKNAINSTDLSEGKCRVTWLGKYIEA